MVGKRCIGSISDTDPQPLLVRSVHGTYAICVVGVIKNEDQLIQQLLDDADGHFEAMSGGRVNSNELVATLISQRPTIAEGIRYAQEVVEGTVSVLIMTPRLPHRRPGTSLAACPSTSARMTRAAAWPLSPSAYQKMGYHDAYELGPAEVVKNHRVRVGDPPASGEGDAGVCLPVDLLRLPQLQLRGDQRGRSCATATAPCWPRPTRKTAPPRTLTMSAAFRIPAPPRHRLCQRERHPLCPPLYQVHPHLAPQLHAHQPEGAGSGGQNEADPRPRAHRGQKAPLCG